MKNNLRGALVAGLVAFSLVGSGAALATSPANSREDENNNVTCNRETTNVNGTYVYAGANGAETCTDGSGKTVPEVPTVTHGRVIVSAEGGYVAADGANPNTGTSYGFIRVGNDDDADKQYVQCGSEDPSDSLNPERDNKDSVTKTDNDSTEGDGNFDNCRD